MRDPEEEAHHDQQKQAAYDYADENDETKCQDTSFVKRHHRPSCNSFQELGMEASIRTGQASFLNSGSLTDVFAFTDHGVHQQLNNNIKFVLKTVKFRRPLNQRFWYEALKDAMIPSAVGNHPLIVSSFGYCGLSRFSEFVPSESLEDIAWSNDPFCKHGDRKPMNLKTLHQQPLVVANNLTVTQKLQFTLNMAESLALLHNHKDGVLVHGDLWMAQFLLDETRTQAKLNDFNNGEIMQFNTQRQEYCPFDKEYSTDYSLAPEELSGDLSGEERDVFRLANNMHYILTGHDLYPNICGISKKSELLEEGKTSFVDPRWKKNRSWEEGAMVRLMEECWQIKPRDRPTIGVVVRRLRSILEAHYLKSVRKKS